MRGAAAGPALVVAAGIFAIDQAIKYWALSLPLTGAGMEVNAFLRIVRVWNTGINFGLLDGGSALWLPYLLAGVSVLVGLALLWWAARSDSLWRKLVCGAVAGGAWGNGFDRLVHGAVHDYLNVSCCGIQNPYAFNLADTAITLGALALIFRR